MLEDFSVTEMQPYHNLLAFISSINKPLVQCSLSWDRKDMISKKSLSVSNSDIILLDELVSNGSRRRGWFIEKFGA